MKVTAFATIAAACLAIATSASAAPYQRPPKGQDGPDLTRASAGHIYYNRAGATLAQHNDALRECRRLAQSNRPFSGITPTYTYQAGLLGMALQGAAAATIDTGYSQARTQLCMVAMGWRVVRLDESPAIKLKRLKGDDFNAAFGPLVGAETPEGTIAARFANEAARGDSVKFRLPTAIEQVSLSEIALSFAGAATPAATPTSSEKPAADGSATLVVRLTGDRKFHNGHSLVFAGPSPFSLTLPAGRGPIAEKVARFDVKPGRYTLSQLLEASPTLFSANSSTGQHSLDFCLGAPYIEVKDGDVLYLGAFDLQGQLGPDMALAPAREALAADPAEAAAVRPADWINGATGYCSGTYFYALIFPDAPYDPAYAGARLEAASAAAPGR